MDNTQTQPDQQQAQVQPNINAVPEEFKSTLKDLLQKCELEDQNVHYALIRKIRKLDLYFNNIVDLFWDPLSADWRVPNWEEINDASYSPRILNYYRAHAESIIAALTVSVPNVTFFPKDADNADDCDTAEGYTNAGIIIQKHNDAKLLFIRIITQLFNSGTVFSYSYAKQDRTFGMFTQTAQRQEQIDIPFHSCPQCNADEGPGDDTSQDMICPSCGYQGSSQVTIETQTIPVPYPVETAKSRVLIDTYDSKNVKIPFAARNQASIGYLILKTDQPVSLLRYLYCRGDKPILEKVEARSEDTNSDSWVRYPSIFLGNTPQNTAVVKAAWFRAWQFELIATTDRKIIDQIQQKYPEGCYVIFVNGEAVEIVAENLDEHWTITNDPRASGIHGEAGGVGLATSQDIQAELDELKLQTIEHGISEVFVDSDAIDWDKYKNQESLPGQRTPVNPVAGKRTGDRFFETRSASLSSEFEAVEMSFKSAAEFISGDMPNIYGGGSDVSNETATAFSKNQTQSLNRLGTVWAIASHFWYKIVEKAVPEYLDNLDWIESLAVKAGEGFKNISVDKSKMNGQVAGVEPEFSEQLPLSWSDKKNIIMALFQLKDPLVMSVLAHPQNSELMKQIIGIPGFYIPGEADRTKENAKIQQISQGLPPTPPDPEDDIKVHMEICKYWLLTTGRRLELTAPQIVQAVRERYLMLLQEAMKQVPEDNKTPAGEEPPTVSMGEH